jgi:parvulin-like peptidyl-prolyl isomerase
MIHATLLALLLAAATAPAPAPSARAFLRPTAASAPGCKATPEGDLVAVGLFSPEGEECPVAKIGADETIRLYELAGVLEMGHVRRSPRAASAKPRDMDFSSALERLITARLLVLEAREIQLDQSKEYRDAVEKHRASVLREMVQQIPAKAAKPDPAEVERIYKDAVREWKIASLLLDQEQDAKAVLAELKGGAKFEALAKKVAAEKKGRGDAKAEFVPRKKMLPEILDAVRKAKTGDVVGPVKLGSGFVILRVEGVRTPKDDDARAQARAQALAGAQQKAVRKFYEDLVKRYAVVDQALLASLDFEAGGEKGIEELAKDQRTLVQIQGEKPITVSDLTREVGSKFFHGIASPIEQHRVNVLKKEAFERVLGMRLLAKEAATRKLASRPEYLREVEGWERGLAFNAIVEKVIAPDVKVTEGEGLAVYEQKKAQLTAPQMYKLDGFAFEKHADAQAALQKLKDGTDFTWLRTTAPGQVPVDRRSLQFDGRTVSAATLAPDLAKGLTNARAGEYRLYSVGEAETYVIRVVEQTPPSTRPYTDVRETIVKAVYDEKINRAISEYAAKLRKAQKVDVLIARVAP